MLVNLLNIPKSNKDWESWSLSHKLHHDEIRQAIETQKSVNLTQFILDPINKDHEWLKRNSETHQGMNGVLGLQGSDLDDLDFKNKEQLESWIYAHWLEHSDAAAALKI